MKDIFTILKKKKLQVCFLFYILLLLPFLSPLAENISVIDKLAICIVCGLLFFSILVLSTFISSKAEKIIYSILLFISIIPGAIFLAYLLFANVLLEQNSVTSLFETNPEESKEFIVHYLSIWVIVGVLIYAAIPIVMISRMKSFKPIGIKQHKTIFITCLLIIAAIVGIGRVSRSVYFVNFYRTFISYKLRVSYEIKTVKERQNQALDITVLPQDTMPQTLVVVVGESLSRRHMSLYGYGRRTNPLLKACMDSSFMFVYTDVTSPQVHTIPVMRSILTMADRQHPKYFTEKPSLFELFNRAGYETYLISNQEFSDNCNSSYDVLITLAQHRYNLAQYKQNDDVVIDKLNEILETPTNKNRLILIHLIGNHMAYEFRYPKEFIYFNNEEDKFIADTPYLDKQSKSTIDKYDNSVLYNDSVVSGIIASIDRDRNTQSAVIYFSDHGEELFDYRKFAGHAYEKASPAMCEVPFIIWISNQYKVKHNGLVFDTQRPYSTGDFIYSISELAGIKYDGYDDTRSLFSPNFKARERFVGEKKYEEIKKAFK